MRQCQGILSPIRIRPRSVGLSLSVSQLTVHRKEKPPSSVGNGKPMNSNNKFSSTQRSKLVQI